MQLLARSALVLFIAVTCAGCYESAFPLDASPQAALDPKFLATWRCITADADGEAVSLVISRAREGVYAVSLEEKGQKPDRYEAYASVVGGTTLFNIRELKSSTKPWVFGRVELLRPEVFYLQVVADKAMTGVAPTAVAVRSALERLARDPAAFENSITCVRTKVAK